MVKLADTQDLGSCAEKRAGSSPVIRTRKRSMRSDFPYCVFYVLSYYKSSYQAADRSCDADRKQLLAEASVYHQAAL